MFAFICMYMYVYACVRMLMYVRCKCVWVHVHACGCVHVYACAGTGQKTTLADVCQVSSTLFSGTGSLISLELIKKAGLSGQGSAQLYSPELALPHLAFFLF